MAIAPGAECGSEDAVRKVAIDRWQVTSDVFFLQTTSTQCPLGPLVTIDRYDCESGMI